jgi:hypothetical protein
MAFEVTLDTSKARDQLGYDPVITRDEGMSELKSLTRNQFSFRLGSCRGDLDGESEILEMKAPVLSSIMK